MNGIRFASKREAGEYLKLRALEKSGDIKNLRLQVKFPLRVNNMLITSYVADFCYLDCRTNREVVADAKGYRTREYIIKKKLMFALLGIDIEEL